MSHTYYAELWLEARKDLEKLLELDQVVQDGKPIEEIEIAANKVLELYYRYRRLVQRLTVCHDQLVQPQIRELAGKMLDYSIARMLEYRQEVVKLIFIECPWPNDALIDLKLTPDDVELTAPVYDSYANKTNFERQKRMAEEIIANSSKLGDITESEDMSENTSNLTTTIDSESTATTVMVSTRTTRTRRSETDEESEIVPPVVETAEERAAREAEEAYCKLIVLIQSHERARVGRNAALAVRRRREFDKKLASGELVYKVMDKSVQNKAALVIQKTWRGYVARQHVKDMIVQTEEVLGMIMPSWVSQEINKRYHENFEERLQMQVDVCKLVEDVTKSEKERIWDQHGPGLVEDVRDEINEWLLMWYNVVGYFDHIPAEKDGGSLLISTGEARTPEEYVIEAARGQDKKKKKAAPAAPKKDDDDDEKEEEESEGWEMPESQVYPLLVEANKEFTELWSVKIERILDPKARLVVDLVRDKLCYQLQVEMRAIADETMRPVVDKFNKALLADHANDAAKFMLPEPQVFEDSTEPSKESKKKKDRPPPVDPLADVPTSDLLIQLLRWKVIGRSDDPPECRLSSWPGVESYMASAMLANRELRMGDVKQAVMDYCVLPICSKAVNQIAPLVRSVCICGPPNSGQLFLARAVCTELRATVFDLTPEKHVGRFNGKESQARLVRSVLRLAKEFAPSVVLVDGGEKAYLKRLPPEMRRVKPKRFASIYNRIVKGIKPGDQVLFLTTSNWPYMAGRPFVKLHDKFIMLPITDYSTLHLAYLRRLMHFPAVDRRFDVSALARSFQAKVPLEAALAGLEKCLSLGRRMKFKSQPLTRDELYEMVERTNSVTQKDLDGYRKFRDGRPLEKNRRKFEEENKPIEPKDDKKKKK